MAMSDLRAQMGGPLFDQLADLLALESMMYGIGGVEVKLHAKPSTISRLSEPTRTAYHAARCELPAAECNAFLAALPERTF